MSQYPKLYNSKRWKVRRRAQLLDEPLCRFCWRAGRLTPATVADHIVPHRGDPVLFFCPMSGLQSLCSNCHDSTKHTMENNPDAGCCIHGVPINRGWPCPQCGTHGGRSLVNSASTRIPCAAPPKSDSCDG